MNAQVLDLHECSDTDEKHTLNLNSMGKTLWMGAARGVSAYLDPPPCVRRWR